MTLDGALFDLAKVKNICKERLGRLNKEEFTKRAYAYGKEYDQKLCDLIDRDQEYFKSIINIEREKENPRKDYENFKQIYPLIAFFYDDLYEELLNENSLPFNENISKEDIKNVLVSYKENMGLELSEEECKKYFPVVKECIYQILGMWESERRKQADEVALNKALSTISSSIK